MNIFGLCAKMAVARSERNGLHASSVCEGKYGVCSPVRLRNTCRSTYSRRKMSTLNSRLLQYYFAKQDLSTSSGKGTLDNVKRAEETMPRILMGTMQRHMHVSRKNMK